MKNQNGKIITQEFYNDKIYVADFSLQHVYDMSNNDRKYGLCPRKNKK